MLPIGNDHPLRKLFAGMVEQAFQSEIGICDPLLTNYLVDLLTEFIHIDALNALRDDDGAELKALALRLALARNDLPTEEEERDLAIYRNIGDYSLFWAGVYPEHLRRRRRATDVLVDVVTQGKRSYAIASELSAERTNPPASLLHSLSEEFEFCIYGLGLVRKNWESSKPDSGGTLLY